MLSFPVVPMKAKLASLPTDDEHWAYEIKWDGYRSLAWVEDGVVRTQSSNGIDTTAQWPELAALGDAVFADRAVLDGEIVVLDEEGRPRFERLQRRDAPVQFYLFDVLAIGDHDVTGLGYEERRRLLGEVVEPGPHWKIPKHHVGDGAALLAATAERGLEGVMAKRLGSTYRPGARSDDWRKVKNRILTEVTIGGFTVGSGARASTFGALLVGRPGPDGSALTFAGGVGTGFNEQLLRTLAPRLRELETSECPFDPLPPTSYRKGARWVEPLLRARIEIAEYTNAGLVRHASFLGLA